MGPEIIHELSSRKGEPVWMRAHRLKSFEGFEQHPMPSWSDELSRISVDDLVDRLHLTEHHKERCSDSSDIERRNLADTTAQDESEYADHRSREDLEARGVILCDMDTALREHPEIVKEYFGTVIAPNDNKFSLLNSALWSFGCFIYVPPGVHVDHPLQLDVGTSALNGGQFERTLIIADVGSSVDYIEGCSAPVYSSKSLRSAVVEIIVKEGASVAYTTIQNWSNNVVNLVIARAKVHAEGHLQWIDANIGSRFTRNHPSLVLAGPKASGEVWSVAYAARGQHQHIGATMVHAAPETSSKVVSKSISSDGGRTSSHCLVDVSEDAHGCTSHVQSDALILDDESMSDAYPNLGVGARDAIVSHEETVSRVADEQLFYLMSRGLSVAQAMGVIVNGFIEPITRMLPMEYAVEWSRLVELQMEGSVG